MKIRQLGSTIAIALLALAAGNILAQETLTRDMLKAADYMAGKNAFQGRCSACHTLGDSSLDLTGPALWGVFERRAGTKPGFAYSEAMQNSDIQWTPDALLAFISDPTGYVPNNIMVIPEPVPEDLRTDLISFVMVETGSADWPKPATNFSEAQTDRSKPPAERFPSFWNHMMSNTTRYRMVSGDDELIFEAYFQEDGSISTNTAASGFWHITERDFFCYALHNIAIKPSEFVECFPIAAMAIPRFAVELWQSNPTDGVTMYGGIQPGRPQ
jgi:cytochrome c2